MEVERGDRKTGGESSWVPLVDIRPRRGADMIEGEGKEGKRRVSRT